MSEKKKPAASGGGQIIKKPLSEKFAETFFGGTVKDTKAYVVHDIVVPAIKNLVYESFTGALDRLLNGNSGGGYYGRRYSQPWNSGSGVTIFTPGASYTNYGASKTKASSIGVSPSSRNPAIIAFDRRVDADEVLARLRNELHTYSSVSVETYYDIASEYVQGADKLSTFTDNYYGWTDLSTARTKPYQGGRTVIVFPPTQTL